MQIRNMFFSSVLTTLNKTDFCHCWLISCSLQMLIRAGCLPLVICLWVQGICGGLFWQCCQTSQSSKTMLSCTTEITTHQNLFKALKQTPALRVQLQSKKITMKLGISLPPYHPVATYSKHAVFTANKTVGSKISPLLLLGWLTVWA